MPNMRFHIIALSGIVITVLIIFAASGKLGSGGSKPSGAQVQTIVDASGQKQQVVVQEPVGSHFITIWEGSWGVNCNERQRRASRFGSRSSSTPEPPRMPEVKMNNVKDVIGKLCNDKMKCQFIADVETLGNPAPNSGCRPVLDLVYRCFSFDRPWRVSANMGGTVSIDCQNQ